MKWRKNINWKIQFEDFWEGSLSFLSYQSKKKKNEKDGDIKIKTKKWHKEVTSSLRFINHVVVKKSAEWKTGKMERKDLLGKLERIQKKCQQQKKQQNIKKKEEKKRNEKFFLWGFLWLSNY